MRRHLWAFGVVVGVVVVFVLSQTPQFRSGASASAAEPTPAVSVTTLPALATTAPQTSASPGQVNPFPTATQAPPPVYSTMSPQDMAAHSIIQVSGEVDKPLTLALKDLEHMKPTSFTQRVVDPDGKRRVHTFTGASLSDVVTAAHPRFPSDIATLARKYVLVTGVSGATAIVAFPEFEPQFNGKVVILAYLVDFKNFAGPGFAMLAVQEDATTARFLPVARITVAGPSI
ncbi:MAG: hypothetical protein ACR2KS_00725 [Candidatus Eremiobacter antarcticus]|nr:hypothetical protein [Candidatus Eremiobacteraeota bacterium]MBC5808072.1 hypothetical protein [Candidatus Eremiobacteraeota bacterium]